MLVRNARRDLHKTTKLLKDVTIYIDNKPITVPDHLTLYQAVQTAGISLPRFCFHEKLAIAGNCRMCLVEVEKMPKPIASCVQPIIDGMKINTKSEKTSLARAGVLEFILANHPLDCPICDQGGECDLQDQSQLYGYKNSRYHEYKRAVQDKYYGPLIKTCMTRCIHCTRCIRFNEEIAGCDELGTISRGKTTEVGTYVENILRSELSANIVDLCPVGALLNLPYSFTARVWELRTVNTTDIFDSLGSQISVNARGAEVMRVLPRIHEEVNDEWISDKSRHAFDGLKRQRLTEPLVKKEEKYKNLHWQEALEIACEQFKNVDKAQIYGFIGPHMDLEACVAFRDFMHKQGVENVYTTGQYFNNDFRQNYLFNSRIIGVENADVLLLIGTNPRIESPVFNSRIRKAVIKKDLEVGLIGTADNLTYNYEHLGHTVRTLDDLLSGKYEFLQKLQKAKRPMVILGGHHADLSDKVKELCDKCNIIREDWNGFNILHKSISHAGALDIGINGFTEFKTKPKLVYLLGCDDFPELPEDSFVIYQGTHGDAGALRANLIFPGAAYTEKAASYVNTDGRVLVGRLIVHPPGRGRSDWQILRALSEICNLTLSYDSLAEIRFRLAELAPHLIKYDWVENYNFHNLAQAFRSQNKVGKKILNSWIDNFYITDVISSNSPTMAQCTSVISPVRNINFI